MKFLFTLFACFHILSATATELELGKPAPEVQARLLADEQKFALSDNRGNVVIINFWATWCTPCLAEMPLLESYYRAHREQGLVILAISMDDASDIEKVRKLSQKYSFPVTMKADANFKGLGRIWRLPTSFVIDRQGTLQRNGQVGPAELDQTALDTVVTPLLASH